MRYVSGAVECATEERIVLVIAVSDGRVNGERRYAGGNDEQPTTDDCDVRVLGGSNRDRTDRVNDGQVPVEAHEYECIVAGAGQDED